MCLQGHGDVVSDESQVKSATDSPEILASSKACRSGRKVRYPRSIQTVSTGVSKTYSRRVLKPPQGQTEGELEDDASTLKRKSLHRCNKNLRRFRTVVLIYIRGRLEWRKTNPCPWRGSSPFGESPCFPPRTPLRSSLVSFSPL